MNITADQLIGYLRKAHSEPEIQAALLALGIDPLKIKLKRGDLDLPVESRRHGIGLNFSAPEKYGLEDSVPDGALVLSGVALQTDAVSTGRGFKGKLPHDLSFSLSRKSARKLLGKPFWSSTIAPNDRWNFENYKLVISFDDSEAAIDSINFEIPEVKV